MLDELKDKLRITWSDEDVYLTNLIRGSKAYLEDITGAPIAFEADLVANELVLERCRYSYNNAADEFPANYADDLLRLRLRYAIKVRSEAIASTDS